MILKHHLQQKLLNGQLIYGTCITSTAPLWPSVVGKSGVDFVFIDTEHIPLGRAELARLCQSFRAFGVAPIVRIPAPDPYQACQVIDGGAIGVVAPYLESVEQVQALVGATKYRPLKGERLQRILQGKEDLNPEVKAYIEKYNEGNLCIANIESVPAAERLDELLSVPGLDAVFIGPHDLSVSLELPEQYDHPDFEKVVKDIVHKTRKQGLSAGIHFSEGPERQIRWMQEGINIIVHSFDQALFIQRLTHDLRVIKNAAGETYRPSEDSNPSV